MSWVVSIIAFVIMLSVLVFIHEGGHYLAARAFHVRVTEFMLGFPGPSLGFIRKGTRFGVTAVPLGGYARIAGMEGGVENPMLAAALGHVWRQGRTDAQHLAAALEVDEDAADELLTILSGWGSITTPKGSLTADVYLAPERDGFGKGQPREVADEKAALDEERKGTYRALKVWKRLVVLLAGPAVNLLAAVIIFVAIYSGHGVYVASNTLGGIAEGSPAEAAGLQAGDEITNVNGAEVDSWEDLGAALDEVAVGEEVDVVFVRGGAVQEASMQAVANDEGEAIIGVYAGYELYHMSIGESLQQSLDYIGQVGVALAGLFNPSTAGDTISQSTSVVGMAYMTHEVVDMGLLSFIAFAAAISISLGLFNLLPIPPLDGGRILIEVIQKIVRRDLPAKAANAITIIGMALFILLFVVLLRQDIVNFFLGGS